MTSIPVSDLKNTSATVALCQQVDEPILVTKNGHPAMWLVKPEEMQRLRDAAERERLYQTVAHSERQWHDGLATDAAEGISEMRARYGL